jgi:LuxR family maltose regulon positive regulatory protein
LLYAARDARRHGSILEISILLALARQALGDMVGAMDPLFAALEYGIPEGYRRTFLDEGQAMLDLISFACRYRPAVAMQYMAALLADRPRAASPSATSSPFPTSRRRPVPEVLSEREIQVIGLMAQGMTYQQIAEELVIALSTVQTHVKNAYSKLDAHSSLEAVSRARQLNLLAS